MRGRWLLIGIPVWVVASVAIAYALVFLTPWLREYSGGSYSVGIDYLSKPSYYDGSFDTCSAREVQELPKLQPEQFQAIVESLFNDFLQLGEAQLAMLNAAGDDVGLSSLIDC